MFWILLALESALALTFTVDTTSDTHDAKPGDGVCADRSDACSLRAAVEESNASATLDRITVPAGTYALTDTSAGALEVTDNLSITGTGSWVDVDATVLGDRLLVNYASLALDNLYLMGGTSLGSGGVIANAGKLYATDLHVYYGTANAGGGLANSGTVVMIDSAFRWNEATEGGGAIYNAASANLELRDCTIEQNAQTGSAGIVSYMPGGGGIYNAGTLEIEGGEVADNVGTYGGGLLNWAEASISDCLLESNEAMHGAAVYNRYADLTMERCSVTHNRSQGNCAIRLDSGSATISQSAVVENDIHRGAWAGDGIQAHLTEMLVQDSTVAKNSGNGLWIIAGATTGGTTALHNVTVRDNDEYGIEAAPNAALEFANSIIEDNGLEDVYTWSSSSLATSLGHNSIETWGSSFSPHVDDITGSSSGVGAYTATGSPGGEHYSLSRRSAATSGGDWAWCSSEAQLGTTRSSCSAGSVEP